MVGGNVDHNHCRDLYSAARQSRSILVSDTNHLAVHPHSALDSVKISDNNVCTVCLVCFWRLMPNVRSTESLQLLVEHMIASVVAFLFYLLPAAMDYLLHHPGSNVNIAEFDKECGVGVVVTAEEIKDIVSSSPAAMYYHSCFA